MRAARSGSRLLALLGRGVPDALLLCEPEAAVCTASGAAGAACCGRGAGAAAGASLGNRPSNSDESGLPAAGAAGAGGAGAAGTGGLAAGTKRGGATAGAAAAAAAVATGRADGAGAGGSEWATCGFRGDAAALMAAFMLRPEPPARPAFYSTCTQCVGKSHYSIFFSVFILDVHLFDCTFCMAASSSQCYREGLEEVVGHTWGGGRFSLLELLDAEFDKIARDELWMVQAAVFLQAQEIGVPVAADGWKLLQHLERYDLRSRVAQELLAT